MGEGSSWTTCSPFDGKKLTDKPKRHCTDVVFLALFICFGIGCFYVASWCFENGQPYRILYGADSWGNVCGRDNADLFAQCNSERGIIENCGLDMTSRPHLFYSSVGDDGADEFDTSKKVKVCASLCPDVQLHCPVQLDTCMVLGLCLNTWPYEPFPLWHPDAGYINATENGTLPETGTGCPTDVGITTTLPVLNRCIPNTGSAIDSVIPGATDVIKEQIDSFVSYVNAESYISDIFLSFRASLHEVIYCLLIAFALSYLVVILMKYFVWYVVWISIVFSVIALVAVTWFLWERYEYMNNDLQQQEAYGLPLTSEEKYERDFYYVGSIVLLIVTIILLLILIVARKEIRIAIKVYQCASEAMRKMPTMLLTPVLTWIMLIAWAAFWLFTMVFMISADDFYTVNASIANGYGHVKYVPKEDYDNFFWYFLFALLWVSQFIIAIEQLVLAGCVTSFYVTSGSPPKGIFCRSLWRVLRYHLGTAALGSLIIAIVQLIRVIFEYIKRKTAGEDKSAIQKFFEKCMTCCLWCLEKCLKFINKNAYIETMLYGLPFCSAACTAFKTILANIVKVAMLSFVGFLVIFVIKIMVAATTAFIAFEWIKDHPDVPLLGLVVFIIAMIAWFIADAFASVVEMTADTLLICYCEDVDSNGKGQLIGPAKLVGRLGSVSSAVKNGKSKDSVEEL